MLVIAHHEWQTASARLHCQSVHDPGQEPIDARGLLCNFASTHTCPPL